MKTREEENDFGDPLPTQPVKTKLSLFQQYKLFIYGICILVFLVLCFALWKIWNSEQTTQLSAYSPPMQQLAPLPQSALRADVPQHLTQVSAESSAVPAITMKSSKPSADTEIMLKKLEDIQLDLADIKACTPSAASQDADNANLLEMIQEMTGDLKKLSENKTQLTQALKASERSIDELTQENTKLKASMATSKKINTEQHAKKDKKTPSAIATSSSDAKAELKTWKVIGLSASRVVLTDKSGKIYNVGVGDMLGGNIKITSVDLESGNIKTSAGSLTYGE